MDKLAISRTTDVTVSFSNPQTFSGASELYALSLAYPDQAPYNSVFNFQPLSNAQNILYQSGGGITSVTPGAEIWRGYPCYLHQ
jgi:hypothetical protein